MEVSLPVASQRGVVYPQIAPYTRCTRLRSATAEGPITTPQRPQPAAGPLHRSTRVSQNGWECG
jgi:hypothetical protein